MSDASEWIVAPPHREFPSALRLAGIDAFSSVAKKGCIKRTYSSGIAAVGCTESLVGIHSSP